MAENVTVLRGQPVVNEDDVAGSVLMPGLALVGAGTVLAGAAAIARFSLERDELGQGVLDAYASGDVVKTGTFHQGHRVLAWIPSGATITADDEVVADAAGMMETLGTGTGTVLGRALDTITATADGHIRIEVG